MTLRPTLALVAAAALALPAAAFAEDGAPTQPGPVNPPPCGPAAASARSEGQPSTCSVRICNDGQASTAQVPCLAPCAPGVRPTPQAPCAPVPAKQAQQPQSASGKGQGDGNGQDGTNADGNGGGGGGNPFALIRDRVWRMTAEADGFDPSTHALAAVVDQVAGVKAKLANKLEDALGDQVEVLVSAQTRVLDANGDRVSAANAGDVLDAADNVKVTGKLLAPRAWLKDVDGTPLPTMRALRVAVVSSN